MSASDRKAGSGPSATDTHGSSSDSSFSSLTRTLEDLEARLSRLSSARADVTERAAPAKAGAASGRRAEALSATAKPKSPVERRFGTIAGEMESLQMQGQTLKLIGDVASDLQALRTEILDRESGAREFEEVRTAFVDLRSLIEGREDKGRIGEEIREILDRLAGLEASSQDRASITALRDELGTIAGLVERAATEETLASVGRHWEGLEVRLDQEIVLGNSERRDLRTELEHLRSQVRSLATDDQVRAVEARWAQFEDRYLVDLHTQTEAQLERLVRGDLTALRERLDTMADAPLPKALQDRLDGLASVSAEAIESGFDRLQKRMNEIEASLATLPDRGGFGRLEARIESLAETIETVAERQDNPELEHFIVLEERLDEISQAIVANALRAPETFDMAPIERVEARILALSERVEIIAADGGSELLSKRIAELSGRIDGLATTTTDTSEIASRIDAATERFEALLAGHDLAAPDLSGIENRLEALAARLDAQAATTAIDADLVRGLEAQIRALAAQLSGETGAASGVTSGDVAFQARMETVERRLDDEREELLFVARAAADAAVERVLAGEVSLGEGVQVLRLSEDLRRLENLSRDSDERSLLVFQAVHSTLTQVAGRLESIEREMAAKPAFPMAQPAQSAEPANLRDELKSGVAPLFAAAMDAAAEADRDEADRGEATQSEERQTPRGLRAAIVNRFARNERADAFDRDADPVLDLEDRPAARERIEVEAPALDPADAIVTREANRPLEPGSGAPDIASLIERVRQQQQAAERTGSSQANKSDFIAAARKAAMAAAAEADALRLEHEHAGADTAGSQTRAKRRRKPILMAVGAVLVAMMAVPIGRTVIDGEFVQSASNLVFGDDQPGIDRTHTASIAAPTRTLELTAVPVPSETPAPAQTASTEVPAAEPVAVAAVSETPAVVEETRPAPAAYSPAPARRMQAPSDPRVEAIETAAASTTATATATEKLTGRALSRLPVAIAAEPAALAEGSATPALAAAVSAGDPKAFFEIGLRLVEGRGGEPNPTAAYDWFARAAKAGYVPAQYSLGTLLEKGNGVVRTPAAARDWYLLAARGGSVRAMHNLAVLHATGIDGKPQPDVAARWFTAAAEHGMRDSQYNLGILFARGAGVPQDLEASYRWFGIVGAAGDKDALSKRDTIAKSLSPEAIARLDAEVTAFTPRETVVAANSVDIPQEWRTTENEAAVASSAPVDMQRAVRNVQAILGHLGYDAGAPDGLVGDKTRSAVRAFQKENGLAETGSIDTDLIRELLKRQQA